MLGHELRNPLAPISNSLGPAPRRRELRGRTLGLRDDRTPSSQLVRLVDDLLDVSRIGQGKIELRRERCDLSRP
jgi:signal transduction histidine kinase